MQIVSFAFATAGGSKYEICNSRAGDDASCSSSPRKPNQHAESTALVSGLGRPTKPPTIALETATQMPEPAATKDRMSTRERIQIGEEVLRL